MMSMQKNLSKTLITLTALAGVSTQVVSAYTYIAKKGDTFSDILYANNFRPIYGSKGSLEQTLKLNPEIRKNKGNKIYPGMQIILLEKGEQPEQQNEIAEKVIEIPEVTTQKDSETREISNIFDQNFIWKLSPSVSWKSLSSTDSNATQNSKATVLSDMSYGAEVLYGMRFNENLDIYSRLFLESVNFSSDNGIALVKKKLTTSSFGIGVFLHKKWQIEAGMTEELFLTSPSAQSVEIKKISMPQLKSAYTSEFYQFQEAALSYALAGRVLLPRSAVGIDSKIGYGAGLGIEAKLRNQSFHIGYEKIFLKASDNSTDGQNIFWRYTWETL